MKFRKDEIPFIIDFYNKDLNELGLVNMKAKPYFNKIANFYFNSVKDSIYGQVQIEKAKYLLDKNSKEELNFQKEIFCNIVNRVLALPDEKLASTNKAEASKFMVENYNDICSLLLLDKLVGPQFNSGALKDFNIPDNIIDALKHKRDLLDPTKNVKPDAKYDGLFINKNNEFQISISAKEVNVPVEGYDQLQEKLKEIGENNGRFERDSFDDFIEAINSEHDVNNFISMENISDENKKAFSTLLHKLAGAKGTLGAYEKIYGERGIIFNGDNSYSEFYDAIDAIKNCPKALIDSLPQGSKGYDKFMTLYNKITNADVYKKLDKLDTMDAIKQAMQKQTAKTLFANIDLLRNKLGALGYTKQISDSQLVRQVQEYVVEHPKNGTLDTIDDALTQIAYAQRTIGEELEFQTKLVKQGATRASDASAWGRVANGIAKIEILKKMPPDQLLDVKDLDAKAVELLKANPNINLNVFMHDKEIVNGYFDDPEAFLNNFQYKDPQVKFINKNAEYARFRQVVVDALGPQDSLPEDKVLGQLTGLSLKAYMLQACESRIDPANGLTGQLEHSYNHPGFAGWGRLGTYFIDIPYSKEDVLKNYEFFQNMYENKLQPSGLTFRQQLLKDAIEKLKGLDPAELSNIDDQKLIDNWQQLYKTWGLAFVARQDLLGACKEEGLVVSDEDRAAIDFVNDQATFVFQYLQLRKDRLCNQYTPFTEGMSADEIGMVDFDESFGPKLSSIQEKGLQAIDIYSERSVKNLALANVGISKIKDILHTKYVTYDAEGTAKEEKLAFYKLPQTDGKTFSLQEPGKEPVFYRYDGKGAYITAKSLTQMNEFLKPHDVTVHIDSNREYENSEYIEAFTNAYEQLNEKITNGANITKEDIARVLVMQTINTNLRNHAGDEDEYQIALKSFVNEDYIKDNIDAITANPAFDKLVDKMGGLDEQGFIKRQNQQSYLSYSALEDYMQINSDIIQGKEADGWNKPLDNDASLAKIEEYKALLANDLPSLHIGAENAVAKRCRENIFRVALLKKNIDQNLGMTTKEIEDKANELTFDPKFKEIRNSILITSKVSSAVHNILEPREGEYSWLDRVYKLVDRCEEVRKPGFETDDMFVERKLSEAGITDENAIKSAKEQFSKLYQANNLIRYSNPDKALSNEDLWKIQNDEQLQIDHEVASEQLKIAHPNAQLKDQGSAKVYTARSFFYNVKENPEGLEKIKEEKAKVLLKGNTPEALQFQKEYVTEMINKMLALPDDKLAMHGTPEAKQYYADHYNELTMLFEVENFMGGATLESGVREDFDIPQNVVEVLRHKKNLAQTNILGESEVIKSLGSDDYRVHTVFSTVTNEELGMMQAVPGEFGASRNIVNLVSGVVTSRTNQIHSNAPVQPDPSFDGYVLNPKDVKIKARYEKEKFYSDIADEFSKNIDESKITINDKYQEFSRKIESTKIDFGNQLAEKDKAKVLENLKKVCDEYASSIVTKEHPYNSLSDADKKAVKYAKQVASFCKEKAAYHNMKQNVFQKETELGIKNHNLDLRMNPERDYTKQMYENIIGENRGLVENMVKDDIKNHKNPNPQHLARLVALDTLYKQISQSNMPAEYVKSFLSEDYIQHSVDEIKQTEEFKTFMSKNEPITEAFVEFDLSEKIRDTIHEMKVEKEPSKIEKNSNLSKQEEVKSLV